MKNKEYKGLLLNNRVGFEDAINNRDEFVGIIEHAFYMLRNEQWCQMETEELSFTAAFEHAVNKYCQGKFHKKYGPREIY